MYSLNIVSTRSVLDISESPGYTSICATFLQGGGSMILGKVLVIVPLKNILHSLFHQKQPCRGVLKKRRSGFNFERNYDVLKTKRLCFLLNKNINFNKNEMESKTKNSINSFRLHVHIMSCTRFRVNPHFIDAWMSRNSLLKRGTIYPKF